jgi:hypothetical protein
MDPFVIAAIVVIIILGAIHYFFGTTGALVLSGILIFLGAMTYVFPKKKT